MPRQSNQGWGRPLRVPMLGCKHMLLSSEDLQVSSLRDLVEPLNSCLQMEVRSSFPTT